ncbi:alpha/beta fold hydrolase [Aquabacterium sp. J223]|uniref:alpha/beta fold hydrolase n=1 Tax=Aquabacterium sp. J223 TaxID=2898431 RepID=UPI0021ADFE25|nr:alpha/beta hydrolase [Aquabacterium sp. J223]UUX94991.1 alpha/beta hydrolase [Aquabacterium sp. J223]
MTAPGARLHGEGPHKAVLLNGWLGSPHHWDWMLQSLDPQALQLAVFDYRGYGARRDVEGDFTFREAAADVLALADALGWERFALVGHSMGGMAMQRVALMAPQRVTRLLGLAPVSAAGSQLDGPRLALFEQAVQDVGARQRIVDFSTGQRLSPAWCARIAADSLAANRPQAMAGYLREWGSGPGFADEVVALRGLPVQVLVGAHDPSINLDTAERSWRLHHPQAELQALPGAGHYPMLEAPVATATALQRWLTA